ncbi:enolase C-terminal domain-like protein [Mycobacterium sp. 3519A]|uniref:enolase C-terminal domain-like protein n=1 Tax=Mycobacterium sp. 3519A TaxID=2057184 RepID=UPI000C7DF0B8|nr:enolase C-terminal domain-like protein [Mycobacterium sp. 3519A]
MTTSARAVTDTPITDVSATAYTIPTDSPEADGTLSWDSTTLVVAEVCSGDTTGLGWTYGDPRCAGLITDVLAPKLLDCNSFDITGVFDTMVKAVRNVGRGGVAGQAVSAVDIAMWDLKARLLDLPMHRLIGAVRDAVPVYGSGGFTTYDHLRLRDQLNAWTGELGIPRVKIKIGESWGTCTRRDMSRIRQARAVIGDAVELYVDANGAYDAKQAIRLISAVDDMDVRWFEEPVSSDDLAGLRIVREAITADVAAGEYGYDLAYFGRMCRADAVDCLQADASRCGGVTEWLRVAAVAAAHGLEISAHCAPWLHAAVAACVPNLRHLEWFHDHARIETRFLDGATLPLDGVLRLPSDAAGHGLTLRSADLEPFRLP